MDGPGTNNYAQFPNGSQFFDGDFYGWRNKISLWEREDNDLTHTDKWTCPKSLVATYNNSQSVS